MVSLTDMHHARSRTLTLTCISSSDEFLPSSHEKNKHVNIYLIKIKYRVEKYLFLEYFDPFETFEKRLIKKRNELNIIV